MDSMFKQMDFVILWISWNVIFSRTWVRSITQKTAKDDERRRQMNERVKDNERRRIYVAGYASQQLSKPSLVSTVVTLLQHTQPVMLRR